MDFRARRHPLVRYAASETLAIAIATREYFHAEERRIEAGKKKASDVILDRSNAAARGTPGGPRGCD